MKTIKTYVLFFLVLFYLCGIPGIILEPTFFLPYTPLTLTITVIVLLLNQSQQLKRFLFAFTSIAALGFLVEVIGVSSGRIFGQYYYGTHLGIKVAQVPVLISLNWAVLVCSATMAVCTFRVNRVWTALGAATLILCIDVLMEQLVTQLDYWYFLNGIAGLQNYVAWFVISFLMSWLFTPILKNSNKKIGWYLIGLQLLFFGCLNLLFFINLRPMQIVINSSLVLLTFILTEFSAWANHKFIMHGGMWYFHADHHKKDHNSWFERNDVFFLMYAIPSWLCIMFGMMNAYAWYTWVGFGIALYGLAYFFVHDIIIHQRFKLLSKSTNLYVLALRRAHKMHHKHLGKEEGESFGMLFIHPKYFTEARKLKQAAIKS